ncbi:unnamed protein product [Phyllotreta striolata]|uniref:DNA polymerase delta subunit 3 n=1 Tax=Phyllotreta striolata TaxID=444603 RepID=A0A9N9TWY1_PHYSR|nr:unnamed protein product [Phyllotreta striolata]
MDSANEDLYFQKLEEFVRDEDKIVTIPYLSRNLNISIQESQDILAKYLKDQRKLEPKELKATYIVTGNVKDKGRGVYFVKEDELKDKRALFDKIDSEVLFSLQKTQQVDFHVISLVNDVAEPSDEPLLGSVIGKNCVKRALKVKKLPTPPPSTVKGKSSAFLPKTDSSSSNENTRKQEPKPKNEISSTLDKPAKTQTTKDKQPTNVSNKSKGVLSSFLSKTSSSSSVKTEKDKSIFSSQASEIEELMEVDFQEDFDENTNAIEETAKKEAKTSNKKKRQRETSGDKSGKKRKRIIERNGSESDDMFEKDESDIIGVSDNEQERIPSPVATKPLAAKNKIRKAVENSYMDEEGFVVTKTEYVYETAMEDDNKEVVSEVKKETKPKLEKKTSSESDNSTKNSKGKKGKKMNMQNQPTLMSFFQKK